MMRDFTLVLIFIIFSPVMQARQDDPLVPTRYLLISEKYQELLVLTDGLEIPDSLNYFLYKQAGRGFLETGQQDAALNHFERTFLQNPADACHTQQIAKIYLGKDQLDKALSTIRNGIPLLMVGSDTLPNMPAGSYYRSAPDIGAIESTLASSYVHQSANSGLVAFPNPFRDMLERLSENSHHHCQLQILYARGVILLNIELTGRSTRLNLTFYPPGVYFVRYLGYQEINTKQIVKI